jgi:hypothetical protein
MSQTPSTGFNWAALSRATQILIGASLLLFLDLFFPWNKFCAFNVCASANGWHRFGLLAGLLALAIVVLEVLAAMGTDVLKGSNKGTIMLALAVGTLASVILRVLMDSEGMAWGAWLGLILGLAVAYGGWLRYQEAGGSTTTTTPTAPPGS